MTRGDIYRVRLPARGRGHEQHGPRYAVIVQAEALLGLSTAIVAPTSTVAAPATFRPVVRIADDPTRVLVEQLRAVELQRLGDRVGRLSAAEQRGVDQALEVVLDL
jgi:mRNA interferase MazF